MSTDPEDASLKEEVLALLGQGRKIEAIRVYRERTGAGLAEAKDAVDTIEGGQSLPPRDALDSDWEKEVVSLLEQGEKIEAIKLYRDKTGAGLKEAKDAVEALGVKFGLMTRKSGCAGMLLAAMLLGMFVVLVPLV